MTRARFVLSLAVALLPGCLGSVGDEVSRSDDASVIPTSTRVADLAESSADLGQPTTDGGSIAPIITSDAGTPTAVAACTKFVSPSGTLDGHTAYKTIQSGVSTLVAGDTLCVEAGTYHEKIFLDTSGAPGKPITVRAYDLTKRPLIDGAYTLPDDDFGKLGGCTEVDPNDIDAVMAPYPKLGCSEIGTPGLVLLQGNDLTWDSIDITRARSNGIFMGNVSGNGDYVLPLYDPAAGTFYTNIQLLRSHVTHIRGEGISFLYVDTGTIADCVVEDSQNSAAYDRTAPGVTDRAWGNGVSLVGKNLTFTGNTVFHTWGEGISIGQNNMTRKGQVVNGQTVKSDTFVNAQTALIKNNVVYDNWAAQIYLTNGTDNVLEGNLIYQTADPAYFRGGVPASCLLIGAENDSGSPANITVRNNIMQGCFYMLYLQQYEAVTKYTSFSFYNNTLVNPYKGGGAFSSNMTNLHGLAFVNNLVYAPQASDSLGFTAAQGTVTVSHNLWSATPPSTLSGTPSIVTTTPGIAKPSYVPGSGAFDASTIELVPGSPALGAGLGVAGVTQDFFGNARPATTPDIGAYQHHP